MNSDKHKYLAEIKIDSKNCDEVIAEAFEILKQATKIKTVRDYDKMRSQYLSRQIKRGLASKRERELNLSIPRGTSK